jgi:hypothetical protein
MATNAAIRRLTANHIRTVDFGGNGMKPGNPGIDRLYTENDVESSTAPKASNQKPSLRRVMVDPHAFSP